RHRARRRGAQAFRGGSRSTQSCRSAVGGHRPGQRRAMGQFSPDLLDGRNYRRGHAAVQGLGEREMSPALTRVRRKLTAMSRGVSRRLRSIRWLHNPLARYALLAVAAAALMIATLAPLASLMVEGWS